MAHPQGWIEVLGHRYGHGASRPAGQAAGISKIVHDLTDRKRGEEERALLLKNAEEARRESDAANQLKDEFLAVLSHELRTPLNAITGLGPYAQGRRTGSRDPAKGLGHHQPECALQARLISDLLDVSRIVSGKLHLELKPVDLPAVIRAAVDTLRVPMEEKEIRIDMALESDPGAIQGDAFRLQQVVWNLVSNAIKFAPRQGKHPSIPGQEDRNVELSVQDDGPGIRPDFLPHIFEPFRQGDSSSTRSHQGLGLGLAIVRKLLHLHGGNVQCGQPPGWLWSALQGGAALQRLSPRGGRV